MNLSAPRHIVFALSLILAVLGLLGVADIYTIGSIPGGWLLVSAYILLAAGNLTTRL